MIRNFPDLSKKVSLSWSVIKRLVIVSSPAPFLPWIGLSPGGSMGAVLPDHLGLPSTRHPSPGRESPPCKQTTFPITRTNPFLF